MSDENLDARCPVVLARMMSLGSEVRQIWGPDDLAAVLRHQLASPIWRELDDMQVPSPSALRESEGKGIKTFADLFFHPTPPLELLELVKRYAKLSRHDHNCPLPEDIAMLLYYLSIGAALLKCGQRISEMDDASLRRGIGWYTQRTWIDPRVRELLGEAMSRLGH